MRNTRSLSRTGWKPSTAVGVFCVGLVVTIGLAGCGGNEAPAQPSSSSATPTATLSQEQIDAAAADRAEREEQVRINRERAAEQTRIETEKVAAAAAAKFDRSTYPILDERAFALIAKDPDSHVGSKVVAYGHVTQFDAATGTAGFRADTGPFQGDRFDYDVNTIVVGASSVLAPIVEGDYITIYAEVAGSYKYDTQMGGSTTAMKLTANIIDVTG